MNKLHVYSVAFAALSFAASARAQEGRSQLDDPYFAIGAGLGFAGDVEFESEAEGAPGNLTFSPESDAEVSFGAGLSYIVPLHRYFALGGKFAVLSWRSELDDDADRNLVFDLAVVPQARLPLTNTVELYVSVPIGLSLDLLNEFDQSASFGPLGSAAVEADPGFGFNIAAMLGARFALARELGLFTELGYAMHTVSHDLEGSVTPPGGPVGITVELDVSWWQIALNAGVYF